MASSAPYYAIAPACMPSKTQDLPGESARHAYRKEGLLDTLVRKDRGAACGAEARREALNNYARSAFQSEKPQIVWCDASDSSRCYGRVAIVMTICARCGFSGACHNNRQQGQAFAAPSPDCHHNTGSLIRNNQTALAQAEPAQATKMRWFRAAKKPHQSAVKRVPPAEARRARE